MLKVSTVELTIFPNELPGFSENGLCVTNIFQFDEFEPQIDLRKNVIDVNARVQAQMACSRNRNS